VCVWGGGVGGGVKKFNQSDDKGDHETMCCVVPFDGRGKTTPSSGDSTPV